MPYIQFTNDSGEVLHYNLSGDVLTVGRAPDNDISIPDGSVSSHHGRFIKSGETYELEDLGSTNGSFVNGAQIERSMLQHGDQVQLGHLNGFFAQEVAAPSAPETQTANLGAAPTESFAPSSPTSTGSITRGLGRRGASNVERGTGISKNFGPVEKQKDGLGVLAFALASIAILATLAACVLIAGVNL